MEGAAELRNFFLFLFTPFVCSTLAVFTSYSEFVRCLDALCVRRQRACMHTSHFIYFGVREDRYIFRIALIILILH